MTMYLTKETLLGNFKSRFILIEDSTVASGVNLFKAVVKLYQKEFVNLHFIYYESLTRDIEKGFDPHKITSTNAVSDPCGWSSTNGTNFRSLDVFEKDISNFSGVICIDSLSPLLFHNEINDVYQILHKLLKNNSELQLIALLHADVHDSYEKEIIEKLATTILLVTAEEHKMLSTIRYSTGKVSNQIVEYQISDDFEFSVLHDVNPVTKPTPTKQPDPTANLTFNLRLKDNEKEARSQLKLPYMQMQNNETIKVEDDMYDEEDPDDDLDI